MPMQFVKGSFAAGELSPYLYARTDFTKYHSGAKQLSNMLVHPQGGVSNRTGLQLVAEVKDSSKQVRLLPFIFDRDESYVLEFGEGYIRFYKDGGQLVADGSPYELKTEYWEADLKYIRTVQSSDTLFVFCQDKKPMQLVRYDHTSWIFQEFPYKNGPFLTERDVDCKVMVALDANAGIPAGAISYATVGTHVFTVPTGVSLVDVTVRGGGGRADIDVTNEENVISSAGSSYFGSFISDSTDNAAAPELSFSNVTVTPGESFTVVVGAGVQGYNAAGVVVSGTNGLVTVSWKAVSAEQTAGTLYADADLFKPGHVGALWKIRQNVSAQEATFQSPKDLMCYSEWFLETSGYWLGKVMVRRWDKDNGRWEIIRSLMSSKDKNYSVSGEVDEPTKIHLANEGYSASLPTNTTGDASMVGKALLQTMATTYDGVVKVTGYVNARQVRVAVQKDIAQPNSWTSLWYEGAWSQERGYPTCGGFYQDRFCAGGTQNDPFMFYASEPGDYVNFNTSIPSEDDDGILARVLARQSGRIREIIPASDLIILTDVGEFKLGTSDQAALSPSNVEVSPQSNRGCAVVRPVMVGNQLLFLQAGGSVLRDFGYTLEVDGYASNDLTVLASHLFQNRQIVDMDYQGSPHSIVWCVRDDGKLLGLTYMKEQEVYAWHQHETEGSFESVCVLPLPDGEDEVYFVVNRQNGKFVERMSKRLPEDDLTQAFFVDSGLVYEGRPSDVIYGLDHLAGQEVSVLADGAVTPAQVVRKLTVQGQEVYGIELVMPASRVVVGLPYVSVLETLPLELSEAASLQGRPKAVPKVVLRVYNTVGGEVGVDDEQLTPVKWNRMDDLLETQPYLVTGDAEVRPFSGYKEDGCLKVVQRHPIPLTVLGIMPVVDVRLE